MNNSSTKLYNVLMGNPNGGYNAIGRSSGMQVANNNPNFFQKRWNSIENALGTTLAAPASWIYDNSEQAATDQMLARQKNSLNDIYKKYGYADANDFWDAKNAAEKEIYGKYGYDIDKYWNDRSAIWSPSTADSDAVRSLDTERDQVLAGMNQEDADRLRTLNNIENELRGQTASNYKEATDRAKAYEDYRKNNYISQKINQDNSKFLGSAINTMSTALDVTGLTANPLANAIQGGAEGFADELEQNGGTIDFGRMEASNWDNFDTNRALQNAAIGAASGAVTGALNKGITSGLAKNGGNLFKGGNALTRGLNTLGSSTALGRVGSTLATGAGRGAISGAVGGATGAGLSSALNGVELGQGIANTLQGAVQGAGQGAVTGGIMAGANMAISNTPGVGKFYNQLQNARANWDKSGSNFDERLTNTLNSGESAVGNWLNNKSQSRLLSRLGTIGNTISDVNNKYVGIDALGNRSEYSPDEFQKLIQEYDNYKQPTTLSGNSSSEVSEAIGPAGDKLLTIYETMHGGEAVDPYSRKSWGKFEDWVDSQRSSTPTTASGWLKKAGERIVEDANKRGVGLGIKDVSNDLPEDVRNLKINQWENDPSYRAEADAENVAVTPQRTQAVTQVDPWDRLAQESGYNNYDEVIQRYMEANPGVELNPNGAAGQILSWLDENPNTPTTAAGWAKKAGQRIVEDANKRGVGLGIKDVSQESPETEIYRRLTGETAQEPTAKVVEDNYSKKTDTEGKLRNAAGLKLQKQYGTIDKPTAKATNAPETLQKIANAGFTKPADVERMADVITGSNGELSKLVSNLVATADPIDTFEGETSGQTFEDFIDNSIQKRGLDGINEGKAVKSQITALMRSLPSRAEGSVDFNDSASDVFKLTQLLDSEAANYEGRSGMNYGTTTPDKLRAAQVIKDASNLLKNRIYDTVDVKSALTPEVADNLKSYAPNNKAWADYVDNEVMTATSAKDLRSLQSPWVRAKKIIDNGYMNSVTYGGRNGGSGNIPLTKRGIAGAVLDATVNSKPGLRLQAKALNKAADIVGNRGNTASTATTTSATTTPTVTSGPSTQIYNMIGRNETLNNADQARTASYLADAAQEAEIVPKASSLEGLLAVPNTSQNSVYNSLYSAPATTTSNQYINTGYFQPTGDYWTDILASALSSAANDRDTTAFASLYNMYQDALANTQKSASSDSTQKLSATQQRANAAMNSLERLSTMTPDAAYNLSKIPLIGDIATFGGNDYEAEAKSLAQQIGYMVSGSNIKESEAENIGKSYVPQPWDNETVRNNKLRRAYQIIQQYQNGYAE